MRCIPAKDFVKIIVEEAKKIALGSETYSPTVNLLYRDLGHKVYARYKVLRKQKTGVLHKVSTYIEIIRSIQFFLYYSCVMFILNIVKITL